MPMKALSSDQIQDNLYAFMRSQILFTALDLDVFSTIHDGAHTVPALLTRLDVDERALHILLNGLVGIGMLTKDGPHTYVLTPESSRFLVQQSPDYMGGMVSHCKRLYENWSLLTDAVRAGQPVGGAHSLAQLETFFAGLVKGLYVSNRSASCKLAELMAPELRADSHILDIAGGSGVWLIAMLEAMPESNGTLLDLPSVVEVSRYYLAKHGLTSRVQTLAGDLEEITIPDQTYDVAIMANICHALGPVATQKAFLQLGERLKPGAKVVVVDFVSDNNRAGTGWPLIFAVNMLICTPEGDVFTQGEYEAWLQAAGFVDIRFKELESDVIAIIAEKPVSLAD